MASSVPYVLLISPKWAQPSKSHLSWPVHHLQGQSLSALMPRCIWTALASEIVCCRGSDQRRLKTWPLWLWIVRTQKMFWPAWPAIIPSGLQPFWVVVTADQGLPKKSSTRSIQGLVMEQSKSVSNRFLLSGCGGFAHASLFCVSHHEVSSQSLADSLGTLFWPWRIVGRLVSIHRTAKVGEDSQLPVEPWVLRRCKRGLPLLVYFCRSSSRCSASRHTPLLQKSDTCQRSKIG